MRSTQCFLRVQIATPSQEEFVIQAASYPVFAISSRHSQRGTGPLPRHHTVVYRFVT